jgi:hypothetical protein
MCATGLWSVLKCWIGARTLDLLACIATLSHLFLGIMIGTVHNKLTVVKWVMGHTMLNSNCFQMLHTSDQRSMSAASTETTQGAQATQTTFVHGHQCYH